LKGVTHSGAAVMIEKECKIQKITFILRQHIPTVLLNTTNVLITTIIQDKPTCFGYKRIAVTRPELQGASVNRAILQHCFFLVRQHWGGCRYRHFAANFKAF
jgi:hypothetical protein